MQSLLGSRSRMLRSMVAVGSHMASSQKLRCCCPTQVKASMWWTIACFCRPSGIRHNLRQYRFWLSDLLLHTASWDQLSSFRISHLRHFHSRRRCNRSRARKRTHISFYSAACWGVYATHTGSIQCLLAIGHHCCPDIRLLPDLLLPQQQVRWRTRLHPIRRRGSQPFRSHDYSLECQRGRGRHNPAYQSCLPCDRMARAMSSEHIRCCKRTERATLVKEVQ